MRRPAHVREGEWGSTIVFWSPVTKTTTNDTGEGDEDKFFVMKTFTVFNVDQVEGSHLDHLRAGHEVTGDDAPEISWQPAEDVIEASSTGMGVPIHYVGTKAYYNPSRDVIVVPPKATFSSPAGYYSTVLHELVHATEHPSRLDWSRRIKENTYGMGELIAELASWYLCRQIGIPAAEDHSPAHIAYLGDWLKSLKSDPKFLWTASVQSSRAADYILSFSRTPAEALAV
jgi:antirestriction protein ArdC